MMWFCFSGEDTDECMMNEEPKRREKEGVEGAEIQDIKEHRRVLLVLDCLY